MSGSFSLPILRDGWDDRIMNIELVLDRDQELNIPVGSVLRLAPMRDEGGQVFAYWIIDDRSGEPLDLVSAECVRVTRE